MNDQVLGAPIAETDADEDTSEARLFKARDMEATFEDAKEAFARWQSSGSKLKENFKELMSVETVNEENSEETREERGGRRPRNEDKGSTTDAKSLKPDMLETTMPQLQIKN